MTFVSVLTQRCQTPPPPPRGRLTRADIIQAIRRIALDLDEDGFARHRFVAMLGQTRGETSFRALHDLVMTLCCQGRRPFVVGHPRSPLPSVTERHVLSLLAAAQAGAESETEIRLTTLLPAPWRAEARARLAEVAATLNVAGVPLASQLEPAPPRCRSWATAFRHMARQG
jgi:hypothetical protein